MVGRSESLSEHSIGPGIRKRKRSETPPKEITSGDEAGYVEEEERAAKCMALHVLVGILLQACLGLYMAKHGSRFGSRSGPGSECPVPDPSRDAVWPAVFGIS